MDLRKDYSLAFKKNNGTIEYHFFSNFKVELLDISFENNGRGYITNIIEYRYNGKDKFGDECDFVLEN